MDAFYSYSSSENGQQIGYCTVCSITSIIRHYSFYKLFKNFEEQVEGFPNVTGDSLVLKSIKAFNLKYFNVLNVGVIP